MGVPVTVGPAPAKDGHGVETDTEERAGSAGYLSAQFTGAAKFALVEGPVTAGPAPAKDGHGAETETEERAGNAGYPTAKFTGAAMAVSVGVPVSKGLTTAKEGHGATGNTQREEGEDKTHRIVHEERDPADRETEEKAPHERSRTPNTLGRRGGEGRGGTPTQ